MSRVCKYPGPRDWSNAPAARAQIPRQLANANSWSAGQLLQYLLFDRSANAMAPPGGEGEAGSERATGERAQVGQQPRENDMLCEITAARHLRTEKQQIKTYYRACGALSTSRRAMGHRRLCEQKDVAGSNWHRLAQIDALALLSCPDPVWPLSQSLFRRPEANLYLAQLLHVMILSSEKKRRYRDRPLLTQQPF